MHSLQFRYFFIILLFAGYAGAQSPAQTRFERWDSNRDNKLEIGELPAGLRANFSRIDLDGDGFLSREEDGQAGRVSPPENRRSGGAGHPEGVNKLADLDYAGTGNPRQMLDLYLPEKRVSEHPLPVVVYIHGGAWQSGDKSGGGNKVGPFVATGKYAGASIGYRLSGEAQWPSQLHDCKAAIRWIKAHAAEYGFDPERIAVWGTSAGGHLVAMLGVSDGVEGLEGDIGEHLEQSSKVRCVLDFFGPAEMLTMGDHGGSIDHNSPNSPESKLLGGTLKEHPDKAKNASPVEHVTPNDAPHLIVHGSADPVVPNQQSVALAMRLKEVGVPVTFITVDGAGHGNGFGPAVDRVVEEYLLKRIFDEGSEIPDGALKAGE
jgi:acetyl esterase/lipase